MNNSRSIEPKRGERIRYVRELLLKLSSQEKLAHALRKVGVKVTRGAVGNWEQGKEINIDNMIAICKLSGVRLDWLAYGQEPMNETFSRSSLIASYDPDEPEESTKDDGTNYTREHWRPKITGAIPELDIKLGAGSGSVGEIITVPAGNGSVSGHRIVAEWPFPPDFVHNELKASINQTIISEIIGDSMSPTYLPGDRVVVDLSQDQLVLDTVYAISDGFSEPQIKRLQRVPFTNPPMVRIISDNPALETFTVELSKLTIVGRVCACIGRR